MSEICQKIVKSATAPDTTDVIWADVSNPEDVSFKMYTNGEWKATVTKESVDKIIEDKECPIDKVFWFENGEDLLELTSEDFNKLDTLPDTIKVRFPNENQLTLLKRMDVTSPIATTAFNYLESDNYYVTSLAYGKFSIYYYKLQDTIVVDSADYLVCVVKDTDSNKHYLLHVNV